MSIFWHKIFRPFHLDDNGWYFAKAKLPIFNFFSRYYQLCSIPLDIWNIFPSNKNVINFQACLPCSLIRSVDWASEIYFHIRHCTTVCCSKWRNWTNFSNDTSSRLIFLKIWLFHSSFTLFFICFVLSSYSTLQ